MKTFTVTTRTPIGSPKCADCNKDIAVMDKYVLAREAGERTESLCLECGEKEIQHTIECRVSELSQLNRRLKETHYAMEEETT